MNRELWALALLATYALLCAAVYRRHRHQLVAKAAEAAALLPALDAGAPLLVLHASQTGTAEELAWQTARALHLAGLPVKVAALGEIALAELRAARHALFIVSSYGEGDPPDSAVPFVRAAMQEAASLAPLQAAVLALGDSSYAQYCGFGRVLDTWLQASGADRLFERIEVDREDPAALARWRQRLSHLAGTADMPAFESAPFTPWRLVERRHLNPGSAGEGVFHLEFEPVDAPLPAWEAGDLVQLQLEGAEPPREYTVASLPAQGRLALMVRLARHADGSAGLASGWLSERLALNEAVPLRLRAHGSFRVGANGQRPLVLVGNGTGLAGLRAHLLALQERGGASAWLIYGERSAAFDSHYADEIAQWQRDGLLTHVDRVFSRDGGAERYVQHRLAARLERLRQWMNEGAAIYVCGSLEGMAAGVDELLRTSFGPDEIDAWTAQGRFRRDVY
ncbi:sulfite reductase subunit alpha [Burkholderiaceae bacterium UC74_6]